MFKVMQQNFELDALYFVMSFTFVLNNTIIAIFYLWLCWKPKTVLGSKLP